MKFYLEQRTLSDDVAKIIRKMILNGTLKPGERLNQAQLADELNISRGPVREAIKLLQNEGLVKHETNKGTFVTTLSLQDAYEIYTLRALLESEAAQLASPFLTKKDFKRLEELLMELQDSFEKGDLEREAEIDTLFHKTIVEASKHQRLIHMHQQLDTQVGAMFLTIAHELPQRATKVVENHQLLLNVLKTKDQGEIKQLFSEHYTVALYELTNFKKERGV
ncbi:GntR family transcriptional regulator [Bacillus sp. 31A1R]|uniref:GntR family transcriptional regulator n=1 Tax=Robertmurraya mangrovi TaxID=3098077 RepID=A0ABU5IVX7_9BACI|nr:GntR family transcriptional regulator [Bacillus sp. 31A1R]MDZ5471318.1 GntR family transcriptional regulator [Bacillus sp. 31A1R]